MARMEIITSDGRRRRWTDEDKLLVLQEAAQPGVRLSDVARRHDILPQQIRRWRRQLFGEVICGASFTTSSRSSRPL